MVLSQVFSSQTHPTWSSIIRLTSHARDLDPPLYATVRPTLTWNLEICKAVVNMCGKTLDLMARNAFWLLER
jgi:hypothetical protein